MAVPTLCIGFAFTYQFKLNSDKSNLVNYLSNPKTSTSLLKQCVFLTVFFFFKKTLMAMNLCAVEVIAANKNSKLMKMVDQKKL